MNWTQNVSIYPGFFNEHMTPVQREPAIYVRTDRCLRIARTPMPAAMRGELTLRRLPL